MRTRLLSSVVLSLSAVGAWAGADPSYRIDRVFGYQARFASNTQAPSTGGSVELLGVETVAGQGDEEPVVELGLCVAAFSHPVNFRTTWSEGGCIEMAIPEGSGPVTVSATVPTVLRVYDEAILPELAEERESSITVTLTWGARGPGLNPCFGSLGGPLGFSATPVHAYAGGVESGVQVIVEGSMVSETQGEAGRAGQGCFVERYSVSATAVV